MKRYKSIISVVLIMTFFTVSFFSNTTASFAQEVEKKEGKQNFTILSDDLNNLVSTYEENGVLYKVVEKISSDMENVYSEIYKMNNDGQYELDYSLKTSINGMSATFITNKNGRSTSENINFSEVISVQEDIPFANSIAPLSSSWSPEKLIKHSSYISVLTLGVAIVIITKAITDKTGGGKLSSTAAVTVGYIAGKLVDDFVPTVYYKTYSKWKIDFKTLITTTRTYSYYNSARTRLISPTPVYHTTRKNLHM